jgi:hypothetical protein
MKITIHVPEDQAESYVNYVADQIGNGFTSGHVDADTNWESEND